MESVAAAQLEEVVPLLNEPLAEEASLTLDHSIFTDRVLFSLHLEVHLINLARRELYGLPNHFLWLRCLGHDGWRFLWFFNDNGMGGRLAYRNPLFGDNLWNLFRWCAVRD